MHFDDEEKKSPETYLFQAVVAECDVDAGNLQPLRAFSRALGQRTLVLECLASHILGSRGGGDDFLGNFLQLGLELGGIFNVEEVKDLVFLQQTRPSRTLVSRRS